MKLELQNISKFYGERAAVNGVTLACVDVRSLVLIGPSGGGKSTLLRILAGLETPDSGSVRVNGALVEYTEDRLLPYRRTLGVVFQAFNLFPHFDALQNITLPLREVHGLSAEEADTRAREVLRRFRLEDHAGHKPAELSGGQRQRVAIARAIASRPKLLLFDEPTSALDPEMTAEVLDVIRELREEGMDFVLVTHEMGFARAVADEVVFLQDGCVVEHGAAEQLFDTPQTQEVRNFLSRILRYDPVTNYARQA